MTKLQRLSFKDKITYTIGAFVMWPMIYDNPESEIAKIGKWKAIKWALRKIWIEEEI